MLRERRTFERYPCFVLSACVNVADRPIGVKCHDISAAGAGLALSQYLPVGTPLNLRTCTKKDEPLSINGTVRWCNKTPDEWRAGVKFSRQVFFPLAMVM